MIRILLICLLFLLIVGLLIYNANKFLKKEDEKKRPPEGFGSFSDLEKEFTF
jgi:flagellar basal body-associated protein FliL